VADYHILEVVMFSISRPQGYDKEGNRIYKSVLAKDAQPEDGVFVSYDAIQKYGLKPVLRVCNEEINAVSGKSLALYLGKRGQEESEAIEEYKSVRPDGYVSVRAYLKQGIAPDPAAVSAEKRLAAMATQ